MRKYFENRSRSDAGQGDQAEGPELFSVPKAFELVTGTRPHPSTCHRYRLRGLKGVRLLTYLVCGKRMTTTDAVRDFIAATSATNEPCEKDAPQSASRRAEIEAAERELRESGW